MYSRPGDSPRIVGALGLGPGRECVYFSVILLKGAEDVLRSSAKCCGYQASPFLGYFAKGPEEVLRASAECCCYQASPAFRLFLLKGAEDVLRSSAECCGYQASPVFRLFC